MKKILCLTLMSITSASASFAQGTPTDPQIAAIVVAANQVDIDAGAFAAKHTESEKVKKFAQMMVTDHTSVNEQAKALCNKLKVVPEENATSKKLVADGEASVADLSNLSGKAFDKAYVDHEVAYHEAVIDVVSNTLIPNASNADLKDLLVKSSPAFVAHLEHAKHLQSELK